MGNIEPNIETVRPAKAPTATMYLHVGAFTWENICTRAESVSTWSYGTVDKEQYVRYQVIFYNCDTIKLKNDTDIIIIIIITCHKLTILQI